MSPQPIVMAPTLHVARTGLPAIVARGGPKLPDLHKVAALMPPREEGQNPVYGKNRDTLIGRPPRSEHAAEKVVVMEDEDTDENALESSLKENGEDSGELSSQEDVEEEEEEEGSDKRDEGGDEEEEKMKENDIDHGDVVTFETEVSSGSESEDEAPPQIKTATRHPPPTTSTAPRLPSNGVVVTSPGATVILPQQPYAIPSMFLSGNRYQVVVPGGVHSNGAIESNQVMQVFNRMGVEPYQVKVVSVDAMSPVIEKEKNKQGECVCFVIIAQFWLAIQLDNKVACIKVT